MKEPSPAPVPTWLQRRMPLLGRLKPTAPREFEAESESIRKSRLIGFQVDDFGEIIPVRTKEPYE